MSKIKTDAGNNWRLKVRWILQAACLKNIHVNIFFGRWRSVVLRELNHKCFSFINTTLFSKRSLCTVQAMCFNLVVKPYYILLLL
jgi:hypothetical protein